MNDQGLRVILHKEARWVARIESDEMFDTLRCAGGCSVDVLHDNWYVILLLAFHDLLWAQNTVFMSYTPLMTPHSIP